MESNQEQIKRQHHIDLMPGDVGETVLLPGDVSRTEIIAGHFENAKMIAHKRQYITYTGMYKGVKVSVTSTGIGGPALAIAVEELIKVGAKNFIRVGTGGGLQERLPVPTIIVGTAAVRGDGTSREYFPLEYPAVADFHMVEAILASAEELCIEVFPGIIRGHDAFYAESIFADKVDYLKRDRPWIEAGVLIVSNESSTLFPLAMVRGCRAGTILNLVDCHLRPDLVVDPEAITEKISNTIDIALGAAVKLDRLDHGE
ncbi:MAG: nucleoside phosphorylase [Pelolinea sp.]|nr:nucleoside phosphorylase [Pelolinea sp.]